MESRGPRSRTSPASRASAASAADGDSRHVLFRSTDSVHLIDSSRPPATHLSADDDAGGLTSVEDASCPWTVEPWAAGTLGGGDDAGERPSVVVGVDFGTTNSCVAVWAADKRRAKVIKVSEGAPLLPTAVSFGSSPPAVGAAVRRDDPAAVFHCKRLIGRSMGDPCVAAEAAYSPQAIVGQPDGAGGARPVYRLRSGGPLVTPDDAARAVLGALANAARAYVRRHGAPGLPPGAPLPAVLTVPAHFGAAQVRPHGDMHSCMRAAWRYAFSYACHMVIYVPACARCDLWKCRMRPRVHGAMHSRMRAPCDCCMVECAARSATQSAPRPTPPGSACCGC